VLLDDLVLVVGQLARLAQDLVRDPDLADIMEQAGSKRYESRMIANLSGVTALVSVQMLESSRATVTDAMVKDALKTLAVRPQVPEAERLAILPYKIGELSGFRVVISSHDGTAVLTLGPKDATEKVEQPFMLMSVVTGEAPKPDERDKVARQAFGSAPGIKDPDTMEAFFAAVPGESAGADSLASSLREHRGEVAQ